MTTSKIKTAVTAVMVAAGVFGGFEVLETAFNVLTFHPIGMIEHAGEAALALGMMKPLRWMRNEAGKRGAVTGQ